MIDREPYFAAVAALMGDPARANILAALMDGGARPAKELALVAGVSPQTASGHLGKLLEGGLLSVAGEGRHRYYRLGDPLVASAIEALMALSGSGGTPPRRAAAGFRGGETLRTARTCYDHLAGRLGVAITDRLTEGALEPAGRDYRVSSAGQQVFAALGIDLKAVGRQRRSFAHACLDWSERRPHLAGALGAAVAGRCFEAGWVRRIRNSRAVSITPEGGTALEEILGVAISAPAGTLR